MAKAAKQWNRCDWRLQWRLRDGDICDISKYTLKARIWVLSRATRDPMCVVQRQILAEMLYFVMREQDLRVRRIDAEGETSCALRLPGSRTSLQCWR
jgi:hypothetical protein